MEEACKQEGYLPQDDVAPLDMSKKETTCGEFEEMDVIGHKPATIYSG